MPGKNWQLCGRGVAVLVAATLLLGQTLVAQGLRGGDVKREFGYITLRDGVKLAYVIYRPLKEGRYPTLLEFSPYGVDGKPFDDTVKQYLGRGYAYAGIDIRGTSCSTGTMTMFDPLIARDGAEVIEWLGNQPWVNGVGMIGVSYPGHTQIFVASEQPKHLKAIAAGATTASTYREVWRPGGIFNHNFIGGPSVTVTMERSDELSGATTNATSRRRKPTPGTLTTRCWSIRYSMTGGKTAIRRITSVGSTYPRCSCSHGKTTRRRSAVHSACSGN